MILVGSVIDMSEFQSKRRRRQAWGWTYSSSAAGRLRFVAGMAVEAVRDLAIEGLAAAMAGLRAWWAALGGACLVRGVAAAGPPEAAVGVLGVALIGWALRILSKRSLIARAEGSYSSYLAVKVSQTLRCNVGR